MYRFLFHQTLRHSHWDHIGASTMTFNTHTMTQITREGVRDSNLVNALCATRTRDHRVRWQLSALDHTTPPNHLTIKIVLLFNASTGLGYNISRAGMTHGLFENVQSTLPLCYLGASSKPNRVVKQHVKKKRTGLGSVWIKFCDIDTGHKTWRYRPMHQI